MSLYRYDDKWQIAFCAASRERTIGRLPGRADRIASAAKPHFRSWEAAPNSIGLSFRRRTLSATFRVRVWCFAIALLALLLSGCRQVEGPLSELPRNQALPAFIPKQLPPFDCPTSFSPSKPVPAGKPAEFFMMGEAYMEGRGVEVNQAKAYAFWHRAAMMGDVRAMVKLGVVLSTKQNNTIGWDMVNIPVATAMLDCAMKKGNGDAAVPLHDIVFRPRKPDGTFAEGTDDAEAEARGLAVLQEGVKLGSRKAAEELVVYFLLPQQFRAQDSPASHSSLTDNALRARYYQYLFHFLDEATPERLPNLDVAVPLPPTPLPDWRDAEGNIVGLWEAATASSGKATAATGRSAK